MQRWAAFRSWWVREQGFSGFRGGSHTGKSIAALKVMIALTLLANFKTGRTKTSMVDLEKLTGLSRPMVIAGIADLEAKRLLKVDRTGKPNEYELLRPETDTKWGKIPYDLLRAHLPEIVNRGAHTLAALKIYLLFVTLRPNDKPAIALSHERIRDRTGIQARHVRAGLDILINHSLIHIDLNDGGKKDEYQGRHNVYTLKGLGHSLPTGSDS